MVRNGGGGGDCIRWRIAELSRGWKRRCRRGFDSSKQLMIEEGEGEEWNMKLLYSDSGE